MDDLGFLAPPPPSDAGQRLLDDDIDSIGFPMNVSRVWAYQIEAHDQLFDLMDSARAVAALTKRQRIVLVAATVSTMGDAYCSLVYGTRLAGEAGPDTASAVLRGDDRELDGRERALATWARAVATDANRTTAADVAPLREAGYSDEQIFGITFFIALRIAFATVNDALAIRPDAGFRDTAPRSVLDAVTYGRPIQGAPDD